MKKPKEKFVISIMGTLSRCTSLSIKKNSLKIVHKGLCKLTIKELDCLNRLLS